MESFGLSDGQPPIAQLAELAAARDQLLSQVARNATLPLAQTMSANEAAIARVTSRLRRSLAGRVTQGRKKLTGVSDSLRSHLSTVKSRNDALISSVAPRVGSRFSPSSPSVLPVALQSPPIPRPYASPAALSFYAYAYEGGPCSIILDDNDPSMSFRGISYAGVRDELLLIGGPFATEDDALSYLTTLPDVLPCAGAVQTPAGPIGGIVPVEGPPPEQPPTNGTPEGPPPEQPPVEEVPPEQVFPPPEPFPTCPLAQYGVLPAVGTPEFCACLDSLTKWFADLWQRYEPFLLGGTLVSGVASSGVVKDLVESVLTLDSKKLIGTLVNTAKLAIDVQTVTNIVSMSSEVMTQLNVVNKDAILGVNLAKGILRGLSELSFGVNDPIHLQFRIGPEIDQIERILSYMANYLLPVEIPSVPEAMECLLRGTADEPTVRCWLSLHGVDLDVWMPVIRSRAAILREEEWIEYGRRHGYDDKTVADGLRRLGWTEPAQAQARVELYDELPSISDHLHWLQRNVFDEDYVNEFKLLDGFNTKFWPAFGNDLRALGMREKYAQLHYASHWINPAPEALRQMVYRLRKGKVDPSVEFTPQQYERVLQEQDVGAFFRPRWQAILYQVPALGYIRDMYRNRKIDEDQLKSYHQDLGYSPEDSDNFVAVDKLVRSRIRTSQGHGWAPSALARAVAIGQIDEDFALSQMVDQGFNKEETDDMIARGKAELQHTILVRAQSRTISGVIRQVAAAQAAGVMTMNEAASAIAALGYPPAASASIAAANQATAQVNLVKRATTRIRSAFLAGEVDRQYAQQSLGILGITPEAQTLMLAEWDISNTPRRRRRTALQYMDDYVNDSLSEIEADTLLTNLGYDAKDRSLFFANAQRKKAKNAQKEKDAAAKKQQAADKQQAKQKKQQAPSPPQQGP